MAEVFTRPGVGWQGHPADFDLEGVQSNWPRIESDDSTADVHTVEAWNEFRTTLYTRMLQSNTK
jgi:hypothetical protein